jgi:hypothetical protein
MLVKATLTHMTTLETFPVLWNPQGYTLHRVNRFADIGAPGSSLRPLGASLGGSERLTTRLFLDSTELTGIERDLRALVERLERWAEPESGIGLPPRILFFWGSLRFQGVIEELREEWVRFDPDGTPTRAWLDLTLRRCE